MNTALVRVEEIISIEKAYINHKHPDFKSQELVEASVNESFPESNEDAKFLQAMKITDDEEKECKILKKFVMFYYTIFRKTVTDLVPKTIMHFLVNNVQERINSVLFDEIYSTSGSEELLNESKEITLNREAAQNMLDVSCSRRNILISF